jgi:hypothetical protein
MTIISIKDAYEEGQDECQFHLLPTFALLTIALAFLTFELPHFRLLLSPLQFTFHDSAFTVFDLGIIQRARPAR